MMGDASVMSSTVGVNADAATSQQIAASLGSQSQTGQGSSGSNMLEKWADSHLDLSSRGWATNMAKTMVSALNRGQERLMFSLSPPSLGRISIAFTSTRGALDVRIQAERKATIALLGDAEGKLTSNLESAGHRVNSLSYADMNSGEAKFDFDHNQSSNNENKGKDKSDSLQEDKSASLEANAEGSVVTNKKADDSLVNITV
jgi:flagellar hook-length control protein FliK